MVAGFKHVHWLIAGSILLVVIALMGGYVVDIVKLNLAMVQNMKRPMDVNNRWQASAMLTSQGECRQLHQLGRDYLYQGQLELALEPLYAATKCRDESWAWFDLGQVQYGLGDLTGAAESWGNTPEGYLQAVKLAKGVGETGDRNTIVAAWNFALAVNPHKQEAYIQLAQLSAESEPEKVEPILRQAIEANPENPQAYIELANYLVDNGDRERAQSLFEEAHALDPSNISVLMKLAENSAELGNTSEAIGYWEEVAFRNQRRRGLAYYQIGRLALADNNTASAVAFFKQAVDLEPANGQYLSGLADAYFDRGCRPEAIAVYQDILKMETSDLVKENAESKLSELAVINTDNNPCQGEQ